MYKISVVKKSETDPRTAFELKFSFWLHRRSFLLSFFKCSFLRGFGQEILQALQELILKLLIHYRAILFCF